MVAVNDGEALARAIRDVIGHRGDWRVRAERDDIQIWVETEPINADEELPLYHAVQALDTRYPGIYVELSLANPRLFVPVAGLVKGANGFGHV